MSKPEILRLRANRCRMVAARYSEHKRQPLLDLATELEHEADALDEQKPRYAAPQ